MDVKIEQGWKDILKQEFSAQYFHSRAHAIAV